VALSSKIVCAAKLSTLILASYDMAYVDIGRPAGWPRRGLIVDAPDRSNESVSRLGNRLNVSVIARFLVEYLAKCRDIRLRFPSSTKLSGHTNFIRSSFVTI